MFIKKIEEGKYRVFSFEGGIPLAGFISKKEAEKFVAEEQERALKGVAEERQKLIDIATQIKNKRRGKKSGSSADKRKIKILVQGNPKKPDSKSYKRFFLYEDGGSVNAFIKAGGSMADVNWDVKHEFIALS